MRWLALAAVGLALVVVLGACWAIVKPHYRLDSLVREGSGAWRLRVTRISGGAAVEREYIGGGRRWYIVRDGGESERVGAAESLVLERLFKQWIEEDGT